MNKTITINLAGINFYIDEDAYNKLDSYLKAISESLDPESRAETLQDIEARIAELFLENRKTENEVININVVDNMIGIMGQPEDYQIDETVFEEAETESQESKSDRKLYRDVDHNIIGGVCSGLSHYFNIRVIYVRIIFLVILIPSALTALLAYILLWILTPPALTTSEKLDMQGEKINIDNIERQVREGFSNIKSNIGKADYSGVKRFFNGLITVISAIVIFIAKAIGVLLVIIGGLGLLTMLFSFLTAGTFSIFEAPWIDYVTAADIGVPFWAAATLTFLFTGIPLFFLFLLGLKILIANLKSIGFTANAVLLGLWILSLFALSALGIRQATLRAFDGQITQVENIPINKNDTLRIEPNPSNPEFHSFSGSADFLIKTDADDRKVIFSNDIDLNIKPTVKNARLEIHKSAQGNSNQNAKMIASKIDYEVDFKNDTLFLGDYFTTAIKNKFNYQDMDLILYLPEDLLFSVNGKMNYFVENLPSEYFNQILSFKNQKIKCVDCPARQINAVEESKDTISSERKFPKTKNNSSKNEWYQKESDTIKTPKTK